jgi:hypothetical protein
MHKDRLAGRAPLHLAVVTAVALLVGVVVLAIFAPWKRIHRA